MGTGAIDSSTNRNVTWQVSTHGVFVLRDGNFIWGWHLCGDGYNVREFYDKFKHLKSVPEIFRAACEFFADDEYSDSPNMNFYRIPFNPVENYADITEYTEYFDGEAWHGSHERNDDLKGNE